MSNKTVPVKRASKRTRTTDEATSSSPVPGRVVDSGRRQGFTCDRRESTNTLWTDDTLDRLINVLQREGFDGDYLKMQKNHLPQFGDMTIRGIFNKLSRWKEPNAKNDDANNQSVQYSQIVPFIISLLITIY